MQVWPEDDPAALTPEAPSDRGEHTRKSSADTEKERRKAGVGGRFLTQVPGLAREEHDTLAGNQGER